MSDGELRRAMDDAKESVEQAQVRHLAAGGVCDFCCTPLVGKPVVTWRTSPISGSFDVILEDTLEAGSMPIAYSADWAACLGCDEALEENRETPEKLAAYVLEHRDVEQAGVLPPEIVAVVQADLVDLYRAFYEGGAQRVLVD